eukprot:NODE_16_length_49026_cov_1.035992.p2 type:complete len:812 gc:universal NODE_16_length_49026_cov_1.035992:46242-48677(+)
MSWKLVELFDFSIEHIVLNSGEICYVILRKGSADTFCNSNSTYLDYLKTLKLKHPMEMLVIKKGVDIICHEKPLQDNRQGLQVFLKISLESVLTRNLLQIGKNYHAIELFLSNIALYSKDQLNICKRWLHRVRRTSYFAASHGINVAFIIENWQSLKLDISVLLENCKTLQDDDFQMLRSRTESLQNEYYQMKLNYLRFNFKEEVFKIHLEDLIFGKNELQELFDSKMVELAEERSWESLIDTRILEFILNFQYSDSAAPEEQYRSKLMVPLFSILFSEESFLLLPEYKVKYLLASSTQNIDICICPHLLSNCTRMTLPPVFIIECSAGDHYDTSYDHKDYGRSFFICEATISHYLGMYHELFNTNKDDFKKASNNLKVYGCMTHNLVFQFFASYPIEVDGQYEIVFEAPIAWRIDLTSDKDLLESSDFVVINEIGSFFQSETVCFETKAVHQDTLNSEEAQFDIEFDDPQLDFGLENRSTKKPKPNSFRDISDNMNKKLLLRKIQFIKQFVYQAKSSYSENMNIWMRVNPEAKPLMINNNIRILSSRPSVTSNTKQNDVNHSTNIFRQEEDYKQGKVVKINSRRLYVKIKEICKNELDILKYLKVSSSPYICQIIDIYPAQAKSDTVLYFELLVPFSDVIYRYKNEYINAIFNYVLDALHALKFLKAAGILHRDISVNNIMVSQPKTSNEVFKLIDFDQSIFKKNALAGDRNYGTKNYIAPELLKNPKISFDHRHDLFSLGCCVNKILAYGLYCMNPDTGYTSNALDVAHKFYLLMISNKDLDKIIEYGLEEFSKFKKFRGFVYSTHIVL